MFAEIYDPSLVKGHTFGGIKVMDPFVVEKSYRTKVISD
jgi:hypothetical protein